VFPPFPRRRTQIRLGPDGDHWSGVLHDSVAQILTGCSWKKFSDDEHDWRGCLHPVRQRIATQRRQPFSHVPAFDALDSPLGKVLLPVVRPVFGFPRSDAVPMPDTHFGGNGGLRNPIRTLPITEPHGPGIGLTRQRPLARCRSGALPPQPRGTVGVVRAYGMNQRPCDGYALMNSMRMACGGLHSERPEALALLGYLVLVDRAPVTSRSTSGHGYAA
jgi:hypothetical protein